MCPLHNNTKAGRFYAIKGPKWQVLCVCTRSYTPPSLYAMEGCLHVGPSQKWCDRKQRPWQREVVVVTWPGGRIFSTSAFRWQKEHLICKQQFLLISKSSYSNLFTCDKTNGAGWKYLTSWSLCYWHMNGINCMAVVPSLVSANDMRKAPAIYDLP